MKNIVIVLLIIINIFGASSSAVYASSEEQGKEEVGKSFCATSYGGVGGNQCFQEARGKVVDTLVESLAKYRTICETLTSIGHSDRITPPATTIKLAASERKHLAVLTKSENAGEFGLFRIPSAITNTPLHMSNYFIFREKIGELVDRVLKNPQKFGQWQKGASNTTRFKIDIFSLEECSTVFDASQYNKFVNILSKEGHKLDDFVSEEVSPRLDEFTFFLQLQDYVNTGCFKHDSSADIKGHLSYQDALKKELLKGMNCTDAPHISFLESPFNCRAHYFMPIHLHDSKFAIDFGSKVPTLFRLQFEHKDLQTQRFFPTFAYMGLFQDESCAGLPILLCHPLGVFLPFITRLYENALMQAALLKDPSLEELTEVVARFSYYWAIAMPWVRGSAAGQEWIEEALFKLHGYKMQGEVNPLMSQNMRAYQSKSYEEYLVWYSKNIVVEPK